MKLLIVEDNEHLADVTARLLRSIDEVAQRIESITLVGDLETAIDHLPFHDAVLCDGAFPISPTTPVIAEEWDVVRNEARRRGIHFVLYSGSVRSIDGARQSHTPVIAKPASVEAIYTALTTGRPSGASVSRLAATCSGSL